MDELVTVAEIAKRLRVSKMTVYRLLHAGDIKSLRIGNSFRVREADLNAYLNQGGA